MIHPLPNIGVRFVQFCLVSSERNFQIKIVNTRPRQQEHEIILLRQIVLHDKSIERLNEYQAESVQNVLQSCAPSFVRFCKYYFLLHFTSCFVAIQNVVHITITLSSRLLLFMNIILNVERLLDNIQIGIPPELADQ